MAGTFGYGLRGFAGGFQTGLGLGMERKKIKMLQEEQKRAEKLAKEKEENAMNWYNTNKDNLMNFHTQPQDTRNMLIFESIKYSDDWHKYLRDVEDFLQSGDLEGLKHLNDIEEERIKAERDMLGLGVRPENAFIGKHYSEEDMDYVKKLQIGKLPIKPIGIKMYEEEFGELPAETKEPDLPGAITYLKKFPNPTPEQFSSLRTGAERYFNVDLSNVTQESLWKPEKLAELKPEPTPAPTAFKTLQSIKEEFKNVKTKAEYDSALASYNASKEANTSDWTPPPFENQLTDLIKKVESAIWADYVNKETGKLKDKTEREDYNTHLQYYLNLIEEAKMAGIDISQFQAFILYKELYRGIGNPLVIKERW